MSLSGVTVALRILGRKIILEKLQLLKVVERVFLSQKVDQIRFVLCTVDRKV